MSKDPTLLYLAIMGGGAYVYWYGLSQYYLKKMIQYTPTSRAVGVAPGLTELSGTARPCNGHVISPYLKHECVCYLTELYKWEGSGKRRRRSLVRRLQSSGPIYVEDDTGMVLVDPTFKARSGRTSIAVRKDTSAKKQPGREFRFFSRRDRETNPDPFYWFISEVAPELLHHDDDLEVHETFIEEGDRIFVLGTARVFQDGAGPVQMIVWDDPARNCFCMADGSEKNALSKIKLYAGLGPLTGPWIGWLGYTLLTDHLGWGSGFTADLGLALVALCYLWFFSGLLVGMYNGLIQLKVNIERAKANIDALLKLRADLIPELVGIVQAHAVYEKERLKELTEARRLEAGAAPLIIALAEAYPEVKAHKNFLYLQKQLVTSENRIAASRGFLNDTIELYNRQIATFPHLLFARAAGLEPAKYLRSGVQQANPPRRQKRRTVQYTR